VTELGIITLVNAQLRKAALPIDVTAFPIVTLIKLLHSLKTELPIVVTETGIVTLVKLVHQPKAQLPIEVTPSLMIIFLCHYRVTETDYKESSEI